MSVLDGLEFRPEGAARPDTPAADTRPEPGLLEQAGAARRAQEDTVLEMQTSRLWDAYRPLTEALIERGVDPRTLQVDGGRGAPSSVHGFDHARIWREAQRFGIEGLPATQAEFELAALRRHGGRDADLALLARGRGADAAIAQFGGGVTGTWPDPLTWLTLPVGGGGRTAATRVLTEGLVAAGLTVPLLPREMQSYARLGEDFTAADALTEVALAGAAGAGIRTGIELAPKVDAAAYRAAAPLRERFDSFFAERDLARAFSQAVPEHLRTPEQEAALRLLWREEEIDAVSPYARTHAGDEAHRARLQEAAERVAGGPPRGPGSLDPTILAFFRRKGYSEAQARGIAAGVHAESRSNPLARNPDSGAFGIGQWLGSRLATLIERYGERPSLAEQLEFLHWELQGGDHGGRAVLAESTEEGVLSAYIGETRADGTGWGFMRPLHGDQREGDLARGMAALGRAGEAAPEGTGNAWDAFDPGDDVPVIRPEALDAERPFVASAGRQVPIATFRPAEIEADAALMQFKSGGDAAGVSERLQGVQEWDPVAAGLLTVWEGTDGRRLIADGHQRLGLARRVEATTGQDIALNAFVLREADGFSARDARIVAALKNVGEGTGSAVDAAKVLREAGPFFAELIERRLPPRSALVRDGKALARLHPEAFGAVVNEVIPEGYGAAIGHLAPEPATHPALVELLARTEPANRRQAETIVRQALEAGFTKEVQQELFGARDLTHSLFAAKARLLDRTLAELRRLKGAFGVAARNADVLEGAGNRIDVARSEAAAAANARALGLVELLALRKGNAVNELLDAAARQIAAGEPLALAARELVAGIRQLDLAALERAGAGAGGPGGGAGGSGRAGLDPRQAGELESLTPSELDELEADADGGPSLFAQEPVARAFDADAGEGVAVAAESDWHDVRAAGDAEAADAPKFDLDDGKGPRTAAEIEAEIAADRAALDEIRKCLK